MGRRRKEPSSFEDAAETRGTIVRTAHDLFMQHGYRAVSTRQIADACGLTQPALYHHFADKQALYVEVIRNVLAKTQSALERIAKRHRGLREQLIQVVSYIMLSMPDDLTQMFRDIEHELSPESRQAVQRSWADGYLMPIAAIFEQGRQEGLLRDAAEFGTDAVTSAYLLLSMIHRAGTGAGAGERGETTGDGHKEAAKRASMLVDVLLYGLASEELRKTQEDRET